MVLSNSRLVLFALCSFSIGTWVGYYWRRRLNAPEMVQMHKRVIQYHSDDSSLDVQQAEKVGEVLRGDHHFNENSNGICSPRSDIMFLKTHKTASSAVQNVLLRYANKADLTVGLSNTQDIRFHYGHKFQAQFVGPATKPINILCHHMVLNYPELQKVMPRNSTYVTILREPSSLFESMFDYLHYDSTPFSRVNKRPNSLEYWLNHTDHFFRGRNDGRFWWFAKNGVFFDMGYDNLSDDDKYIQQAISELDKIFDLVLLSDYFAESMLLLREHLCWSMADILALKTNARDSPKTVLTDRVRKKIYEWNKADAAVYQHFNRTFWKKVEAYGYEKMKADMKILEKMNAELQHNCIDGGAVSNRYIKEASNKVYNPRGVVMKGYNLKGSAKNNQTCIDLIKGEVQWTRQMMAQRKARS
ncbi:galactosylceramide sulfotransferase-like [Styela clava]